MKRQRSHRARLYLTPDQLATVDDQGHGARAKRATKPLALSDGSFREHDEWLRPKEEERLRRLECTAARKRDHHKPGERNSNRIKRTYAQLKQLRARATRRAMDWQHKTTTELADTFGVIGVEDSAGIQAGRPGRPPGEGPRPEHLAPLSRLRMRHPWQSRRRDGHS
ncbi:hypothetical protein ACFWY6_07260 [Streptomyces sp. NPDC059037]|uniref:hypothetical protein n=1 Tax=Streptomyces sp. NPDC059037 TaxID=3346710 RepID=UPI0036CDCCBF